MLPSGWQLAVAVVTDVFELKDLKMKAAVAAVESTNG